MNRTKLVTRSRITLLAALAVILACAFLSQAEPVSAKSPSLNARQLHMQAGQSYTLKLSGVTGAKWTSSDKTVASVKKGKVKALKAGKTIITAKKGKKKYRCNVTIASGEKKTLIIYFSATGHTKKAAAKLRKAADSDIVPLLPKKAYKKKDLTYEKDCRANAEQDKNTNVAIATVIRDLKKYDTIYIGYPIWWGKEPGVIRTFLKKNSLKGKTLIPFCTSGGSGISGSMSHIRSLAKGASVQKGKDLTDMDLSDIKSWVKKNTASE